LEIELTQSGRIEQLVQPRQPALLRRSRSMNIAIGWLHSDSTPNDITTYEEFNVSENYRDCA
jgi:hypothetical protein